MTERNAERLRAKELLSPEELADYLGCGRTFAYKLLGQGKLPSLRLGRLRKVRRADVDDYIERQLQATE